MGILEEGRIEYLEFIFYKRKLEQGISPIDAVFYVTQSDGVRLFVGVRWRQIHSRIGGGRPLKGGIVNEDS